MECKICGKRESNLICGKCFNKIDWSKLSPALDDILDRADELQLNDIINGDLSCTCGAWISNKIPMEHKRKCALLTMWSSKYLPTAIKQLA